MCQVLAHMTAAVLTWVELCESPVLESINAPAVDHVPGLSGNNGTGCPLKEGYTVPFYLVAAIGSDLGRFAALDMIQSKQARGR